MKRLYLSKSKYCSAVQCPKMLWMHKYKKDFFDDSVLDEAVLARGNEVGDIAMGLFGEYVEVKYGKPQQMIDHTAKLIEQGATRICEASFAYKRLFCSVDIFTNSIDGVDICEVKSSTEIKDIYLHDVAFQHYVLKKLGHNVKNIYIAHIDNSYVRFGELDIDRLFTISDVTDEAKDLYDDVDNRIEFLTEYMCQTDEPEMDISEACTKPYTCGYYGYCSRHLPTPNIFDIARIRAKKAFNNYRMGNISYIDVLANVGLSKLQEMQVIHELNDLPPFIDSDKINMFLRTLNFPLYFLDFETFQQAIPTFNGQSPYQQIPFQYSLHYLESMDDELKHTEFLAGVGIDPRRELAQSLTRDIPKDVCILAYNMSFEKSVIKRLANQYENLSDHLMNIHDNIKDLMIPFQQQSYYSKLMKGSCSIKNVLPALFPDDEELNYGNLEGVHNGSEAMNAYAQLSERTEEEREEIRKQLLKYCKLDTYAMVKIWQKLYEAANISPQKRTAKEYN